jgi:hypothetical protein
VGFLSMKLMRSTASAAGNSSISQNDACHAARMPANAPWVQRTLSLL